MSTTAAVEEGVGVGEGRVDRALWENEKELNQMENEKRTDGVVRACVRCVGVNRV